MSLRIFPSSPVSRTLHESLKSLALALSFSVAARDAGLGLLHKIGVRGRRLLRLRGGGLERCQMHMSTAQLLCVIESFADVGDVLLGFRVQRRVLTECVTAHAEHGQHHRPLRVVGHLDLRHLLGGQFGGPALPDLHAGHSHEAKDEYEGQQHPEALGDSGTQSLVPRHAHVSVLPRAFARRNLVVGAPPTPNEKGRSVTCFAAPNG
jgi:hypothetical protein